MKSKQVIILFTVVFFFVGILCVWNIHEQNVRFSPTCRTAWTLRVVKVVDHIVRKGESLTKIAKKYGVSLQEILKANNMDDSEGVKAGEKIKIPLKSIKGEILI